MVRHRLLVLVPVAALLPPLALPSGASGLGMLDSYPRTVAVTGTGEGVRLTRMQASVRPAGKRVRVTVRLSGASVAGTRQLATTVAPCTVMSRTYKNSYQAPDAPARPTCRATARRVVTVREAPFAITQTFMIPRPATSPGALRVRLRATGTKPAPPCTVTRFADSLCKDPRFALTGDLLLNGNTWKSRPGTWWGITATPPTGVTFDRIVFNSRTAAWVATSTTAAKVVTTTGYAGATPARTKTTALGAGIQGKYKTSSTFGGEGRDRPVIRVLDYAATIDSRRIFAVTLPLPHWQEPKR